MCIEIDGTAYEYEALIKIISMEKMQMHHCSKCPKITQ